MVDMEYLESIHLVTDPLGQMLKGHPVDHAQHRCLAG
jgi:hypothetical protein